MDTEADLRSDAADVGDVTVYGVMIDDHEVRVVPYAELDLVSVPNDAVSDFTEFVDGEQPTLAQIEDWLAARMSGDEAEARPGLVVGQTYEIGELRDMFPGALFVGFDLDDETSDRAQLAQVVPEDHPLHPDPRCHECGELLGDADRAEVVEHQALVEGRDEHHLVHADPCYLAHQDRYALA